MCQGKNYSFSAEFSSIEVRPVGFRPGVTPVHWTGKPDQANLTRCASRLEVDQDFGL